MKQVSTTPTGLVTTGDANTVPQGGLLRAHNVCLREPGVITPRPGFDVAHPLTDENFVRMIAFDGDILCRNATYTPRWSNDSQLKSSDSNGIYCDDNDSIHSAQLRGNLYLTGKRGLEVVAAARDTSARFAGLPRPGVLYLSYLDDITGTAIPTGYCVRYAVVLKYTDDNGVILRSAPSNSLVVSNTTGSTASTGLAVYIGDWHKSGMTLEFYRSAAFTDGTIPDEELYLVGEYVLTSSDISAGYAEFIDNVPTSDVLGATGYFCPSQDGWQRFNDAPPWAASLATYKNSMFFGNTKSRHRVVLRYRDSDAYDLAGDEKHAGYRDLTGDYTSGSADVANVSDTSGLEVGQYIEASSYVQASTYIASIAGSTVTMTKTASDTGTAKAFRVIDVMVIKITGGGTHKFVNLGTADYIGLQIMTELPEYGFWTDSVSRFLIELSGQWCTIAIEDWNVGTLGYPFKVYATHGDEFEPNLNGPTWTGSSFNWADADGYDSQNDEWPDAVRWSKVNEPEHVPLGNYARIGDAKSPVQNLVVFKEHLFIFKTDGIWVLSGAGERSGWALDVLDRTYRLVRPDSVCTMPDAIYALTNRGPIRITTAGIEDIGLPVNREYDLAQGLQALLATSEARPAVYVSAHPRNHEVFFSVPRAQKTYFYCDQHFIFNTLTGAWTTWEIDDQNIVHLIEDPADGLLKALDSSCNIWSEKTMAISPATHQWLYHSDRSYTITISAVSGNDLTVSGWTISVGDVITPAGDSVAGIVTAVTDTTHCTIEYLTNSGASGTLSPGSATAYKRFTSEVQWRPRLAGDTTTPRRFLRGVLGFDSFERIQQATLYFLSDYLRGILQESYAFNTIQFTYETFTALFFIGSPATSNLYPYNVQAPRLVKFGVPRNMGSGHQLSLKMVIAQAGCWWRLTSMALEFEELPTEGIRR